MPEIDNSKRLPVNTVKQVGAFTYYYVDGYLHRIDGPTYYKI